jgi:hypothetical protein
LIGKYMKALKSLSKAVPKRARFMFLAGLCVMGVILVVVWRQLTGASAPQQPVVQSGVQLETTISKIEKSRPDEATTIPEDSPMMKELKETEEKKIVSAEEGDESYISSLRFKQKERAQEKEQEQAVTETKAETGIDDIIARRNRERANAQNAQNGGAAASQAVLFDEDAFLKSELEGAKSAKESMKKVVAGVKEGETGFVAVSSFKEVDSEEAQETASSYTGQYLPKYKKAAGNKGGARDFSDQVTDVAAPKIETKTLNRGKRYYSVLNIGVNTDEISPTTATVIEGGDLIGAEFIAETPTRAGEKAVVIFNSMSVGGKDYSVRAIALDPETQRSGLADNVNRHIMERYLKLGIASFVDGYAESLQDSTTTISPEGSTTTKTNSVPDGATQTKIAIGKTGEAFVPAFEEEFKRPPTVEVYSNREVVVMLLDPIELPKVDVVK